MWLSAVRNSLRSPLSFYYRLLIILLLGNHQASVVSRSFDHRVKRLIFIDYRVIHLVGNGSFRTYDAAVPRNFSCMPIRPTETESDSNLFAFFRDLSHVSMNSVHTSKRPRQVEQQVNTRDTGTMSGETSVAGPSNRRRPRNDEDGDGDFFFLIFMTYC